MDEEIQKILFEALPINNELLENSKNRDLFDNVLKKYLAKIINCEHPYSLFDSIFNIFQKVLGN